MSTPDGMVGLPGLGGKQWSLGYRATRIQVTGFQRTKAIRVSFFTQFPLGNSCGFSQSNSGCWEGVKIKQRSQQALATGDSRLGIQTVLGWGPRNSQKFLVEVPAKPQAQTSPDFFFILEENQLICTEISWNFCSFLVCLFLFCPYIKVEK